VFYLGYASDEVRKIHLPLYDEIYVKVKNRVGKILLKYKKARGRNPRGIALEILDTGYQVIRDKLLAYRVFGKAVLGDEELRTYVSTVLGDEALKTLRVVTYLPNRLRNLWLTLRREIEYTPEQGEEINQSLRQVSRLLSYVKRKRKILREALEIKKELSLLPGLPGYPRVVIVGPPNAGKSSLANKMSKTKTKIAEYPFTTKAIEPGVSETIVKGLSVTVLDTPGLLSRPNEDRNIIEKRALAAIKLPNTIVIYVIDPFSTIMSLEEQLDLLGQVINLNPNVVIVINKTDIDKEKAMKAKEEVEKRGYQSILISALTGEGIDTLTSILSTTISTMLKEKGIIK
jgi:small GTP-binding protein